MADREVEQGEHDEAQGVSAAGRSRRRWLIAGAIGVVAVIAGASVSVAALTRDQPAQGAPLVASQPPTPSTTAAAPTPSESVSPVPPVCTVEGVEYHETLRLDSVDLSLPDRAYYAFDAPAGEAPAISPERELFYTAMPDGATLVEHRTERGPGPTDSVFTLVDSAGVSRWTIELPGVTEELHSGYSVTTPLISGVEDRLLVAVPDGGGATVLHVVDTETGEVLATRDGDRAYVLGSSRRQGAAADGIVVVEPADHFFERSAGALSALDPDTLVPSWSVPIAPTSVPEVVGGVLSVDTQRYDARTGAELPWAGEDGLGVIGSTLTTLADDGVLRAIDPRTGEICWTREGVYSMIAKADGAVVVDVDTRVLDIGEDGLERGEWARGTSTFALQILGGRLAARDGEGWSVYPEPGAAPVRVASANSSWGAWTEIIGYDEDTLVLSEGVYTGVLGVADLATGTVAETEKWDHDTTAVSGRLLLDTRLLPAQEYDGLPPVVARDGTYFVLERG